MSSPLSDAVKLPCGLVFPNRFVKVKTYPDPQTHSSNSAARLQWPR